VNGRRLRAHTARVAFQNPELEQGMSNLAHAQLAALYEDDLPPLGRVVLAAIEDAHEAGLLYGGSSLDPSGWANSTFPEAARRIAAAVEGTSRRLVEGL